MSDWSPEVDDGVCDGCGESNAVAAVASLEGPQSTLSEVALCSRCLHRALEAIEVYKENNW